MNYLHRITQTSQTSSRTKEMKFTTTLTNPSTAARLGALTELRSAKDAVHHTPTFILSSKGGAVPHLTFDTLKLIPKVVSTNGSAEVIMNYPLVGIDASTDAVKASGKGIAGFVGMQEFSTYISVQDLSELQKPGYNDHAGVSIWSRNGRKSVTAESYVKSMATFQPDIWQALVDADTVANISKKRLKKALERNEGYLKKCVEARDTIPELKGSSVVATIVGGTDLKAREESTILAASSGADAFAFEGLHSGGPETVDLQFNAEIKSLVTDCLDKLPGDKPRFLFGAFHPSFVVEAVKAGFDVFDSSLPYLATEKGMALDIPFQHQAGTTPTETVGPGGDANGLQNGENGKIESSWNEFTIDLKSKKFAEDFSPLSPNCDCYSCRKHSRGYIHYLLGVNEMLAPVLLMIHNIHHFAEFFAAIRATLKKGEVFDLKKR